MLNVHLRASEESSARVAELEADARRYRAAFEGVAQGVCMFDGAGRLVAANRSFVALHRLPPNALPPFASLREVAAAMEAAGACPMAAEDYVAYCEAIRACREPRVWCATLADGRVLRIRHQPTDDGGWIAFHADVGEGRETRRLRQAYATLQALIDRVPGHLWVKDCDSRFVAANLTLAADHGRSAAADVIGLTDFDLRPDEAAKERRQRELGVILSGQPNAADETFVAARGERKRLRARTTPLHDADGRLAGLIGVALEAVEAKAPEAATDEVALLDMVAAGATAEATLGAALRYLEAHSCGLVASVLRLDESGERLGHAAASILPDALRDATDGLRCDAEAPAFAKAVHSHAPLVSLDLAVDPQWGRIGALAAASGFHACWATPIFAKDDEPLGVFAVYARAARAPDGGEARRLRFVSRLAAIAIEREATAKSLARVKMLL